MGVVPVNRIEALTGLSYGSLRDVDPTTQVEAERPALRIDRSEQTPPLKPDLFGRHASRGRTSRWLG